MTKADFLDWKRHPVTVEVFGIIRSRQAGLKDELVGHAVAGNVTTLAQKAGAVLAFDELLNIDFEDSNGD